MNKQRLRLILVGETVALAFVLALIPTAALAHHIDVTRSCTSVTVQSFSDGTMTVLAQTGDVFAVGQTAPPGSPGLLTKPATPDQTGSVTVTWTTDHSQQTVTWGESADCIPTTTSSTTSSTSTSTSSTSTTSTTAPPTTSTAPPTTLPTTTTTECIRVGDQVSCDHDSTTTRPATTVPTTSPPTTELVPSISTPPDVPTAVPAHAAFTG